jgi:hypothetical protein
MALDNAATKSDARHPEREAKDLLLFNHNASPRQS